MTSTCLLIFIFVLFGASSGLNYENKSVTSLKRALQVEHEKPQAVKWRETFIDNRLPIDYQLQSLVKLLNHIANKYFNQCTVMILYDAFVLQKDRVFLQQLFGSFPLPFVQGIIDQHRLNQARHLQNASKDKCISYILFLSDVMSVRDVIGDQSENKVVIVASSSQWRVNEFLQSEVAQNYVNLLVIVKSEKTTSENNVIPYILYTHEMYIDGLGSSRPRILTSWYKSKLSRSYVRLFPKKITKGFAGHRFLISIADQPPFVINRGKDSNDDIKWDGIEVRLIKILSETLNFTRDYHEAKDANIYGSSDAVVRTMREGKSNLGVAGLYVTQDRIVDLDISHGHSQDCASFITLTSTALPRYRAIMGPFQWTVWLALTLVYILAIFPISFSDKLTLSHLIRNPEEMENMFWYVFGTFTNCFTFTGKRSWNKSKKMSTRLFVGWYWVFTIIISACYTGSIIAFVTLPVYPSTVDTVPQLISGRYRVGTLDKGGWQYWFQNSTDVSSERLLKNLEYLPDVASGLKNITSAWLWPYAFLGSRDQLDYIVRTNFTTKNKRQILHISTECFVPYSVSIAFPKNAVYRSVLNSAILRAFQGGLITKLKNDVQWDIMRSATGKLLQANSVGTTRVLSAEDRSLTLQDTQGMFLLLAAGFIIGGASLLSEWLGGCFNFCKGKRRFSTVSVISKKSLLNEDKVETNGVVCNSVDAVDAVDNECRIEVHHNVLETGQETTGGDNVSLRSKDLDNHIDELFNFDYLFGDKSSLKSEKTSFNGEVLTTDKVEGAEDEDCNEMLESPPEYGLGTHLDDCTHYFDRNNGDDNEVGRNRKEDDNETQRNQNAVLYNNKNEDETQHDNQLQHKKPPGGDTNKNEDRRNENAQYDNQNITNASQN